MAFDIFLKFDPAIEGGSMHSKFQKHIEVQSFSWGVHNPAPGAKEDLPAVQQDLNVSGRLDVQSPKLFEASAKGTNFVSAELLVVTAGENQQIAHRLRLTDVRITSYQASGGGDSGIFESYSLSYRILDNVFQSQKADGTPGPTITGNHDFGPPAR
jgi:type VI protein secretion system component Hcp